jgi:hypothetical protein
MDARWNLFDNPVAAKLPKYLTSANKVVSDSTLPTATKELLRLRASQINGLGGVHAPTKKNAVDTYRCTLAGHRRALVKAGEISEPTGQIADPNPRANGSNTPSAAPRNSPTTSPP